MNKECFTNTENGIIATIENATNPSQVVAIKYLPNEQAFVTAGIFQHFGEKEILMPAHLVVIDFELMGTIISVILERLSHAQEMEQAFAYAPKFEVLGTKYTFQEFGDYMKLSIENESRSPFLNSQ